MASFSDAGARFKFSRVDDKSRHFLSHKYVQSHYMSISMTTEYDNEQLMHVPETYNFPEVFGKCIGYPGGRCVRSRSIYQTVCQVNE